MVHNLTRITRLLTLVVALMLAGLSAVGAQTYTITDLEPEGSTRSEATGINNNGDVVGWFITSRGTTFSLYYNSGIGVLFITTFSSAAAGINDTGQWVGWYQAMPSGYRHALLYNPSDDTFYDLGTLDGRRQSEATAINANGQVVGFSYNFSDVAPRAFLWDGRMQDLGTLGRSDSEAYAINNNGQVAGTSSTEMAGIRHAFLYDGRMQDLGTLPGDRSSSASGINDSGQVVGGSAPLGPNEHAFLYDRATGMRDLGTIGNLQSHAFAINNNGQVVGTLKNAIGDTHAFLWQDGQMIDINDLIPAETGWTLLSAKAINDAGQIVGMGLREGRRRAVLLTPQ